MKLNYKLRRLCGSYYGYPELSGTIGDGASRWTGGNIVYADADRLVATVLNRIQIVDLKSVSVRTLPIETRSNIAVIAVAAPLLVTVDVQNYATLIQMERGVVLHRWRFQDRVRCLEFSPSGRYLAVGTGHQVQVWIMPNLREARAFAPLTFHRTYHGVTDEVTALAWSPDESVLAAASRDCTVKIWTLNTTVNYVPATLSNNKAPVVGLYFGTAVASPTSSSSSMPNASNGVLLYTIAMDRTVLTWAFEPLETKALKVIDNDDSEDGEEDDDDKTDAMDTTDAAVDFFSGAAGEIIPSTTQVLLADQLVGAKWRDIKRLYLMLNSHDTVASTSYCPTSQLMAVGFSSGTFGIYEMPEMTNIHTLSVGNHQLVKTCQLNASGEWLALACPSSQQLLVWEWRSETYVLKQRGHAYGMRCMAYAPDGVCLATGGEDGKIKVWNSATGFCYVTFDEKTHTAPITGIAFANASVILTASLDGTVKAHDLHRYRTFKTMTAPTAVQFLSLAVDGAGEIVVAGSSDPFHVYCWNLQTGKLLDILTGHTGPVCSIAFQQGAGIVASASWDGTIKTWDLYKGSNIPTESFQHTTDVVCVAFRPDGKQVCSGTIGGLLSFWDVEAGKLLYEIDGRNDITGGRKMNDRVAATNNAASRYFTSVCYSADGSCVLAGGNSKYVCIYEVSQRILLKKFQISYNRSLDGVLDELHSKNLTEAGPINEEAAPDEFDGRTRSYIPGAKRGDDGSRKSKVEVLSRQLSFSSTGREWAVVSGEGLHVFSLDDDMIFDPISLSEAITPDNIEQKLAKGDYSLALRMALHLNEYELVKTVIEETPYKTIPLVVRSVGTNQVESLMQIIGKITEDSPHIEFYVEWCLQLLQIHGIHIDKNRGQFMRALRAMHRVLTTKHDDLNVVCTTNKYALSFMHDHATLLANERKQEVTMDEG